VIIRSVEICTIMWHLAKRPLTCADYVRWFALLLRFTRCRQAKLRPGDQVSELR
jgi:hypothetical protein